MNSTFDCIIIGAGHAGIEAALSCSIGKYIIICASKEHRLFWNGHEAEAEFSWSIGKYKIFSLSPRNLRFSRIKAFKVAKLSCARMGVKTAMDTLSNFAEANVGIAQV